MSKSYRPLLSILVFILGLVALFMIIGFVNFEVNPPQATYQQLLNWAKIDNTVSKVRNGNISSEVLASGYGKYNADYRVPFDIWIKDPQTYRNNAMNFFEKSYFGVKRILTQKNAWKKQKKEHIDFNDPFDDIIDHYNHEEGQRWAPQRSSSSKSDSYNNGYSLGWDKGYHDGVNGNEMWYSYDESRKSGDYLSGYTSGYEDGFVNGKEDYDKR